MKKYIKSIKILLLIGAFLSILGGLLPILSTVNAQATDGSAGSLSVTLNPNQASGVSVVANRKDSLGSGFDTITLNYNSGSKTYESGPISYTGSDNSSGCSSPEYRVFDVVAYKGSSVIGRQDSVRVDCSQNKKVTVNVQTQEQQSSTGTIALTLQYRDVNDGKTKPYKSPAAEIIITDHSDSPSRVVAQGTTDDQNGHFTRNLQPGTRYRVVATYPGDGTGAGGAGYYIVRNDIEIKRGETTRLTLADTDAPGATEEEIAAVNDAKEAKRRAGAGEEADGGEVPCRASGGFTWIICGAINLTADFIHGVQNHIIKPFLEVDPLTTHDGGEETATYSLWKYMRTIANVLLVLVFLGIIFGQTLGIDAYTIKKALPRLIVAAIAIQFSYFIAAIMVDITNVIGRGIRDIMTAGLESQELFLSGIDTTLLLTGIGAGAILGGTAVLAAGATSAVFIMLAFLAGGFLLVVFTLVFRQVLIAILAVATPLAFAAAILPNTEKFFKMWWSYFSRALMMYPLILALFAAGDIVANLAIATTGESVSGQAVEGFSRNIVRVIMALAALIVPLFLIPATFKVAGAAIAAIGGMIGNAEKKMAYGRDGKSGFMGRMREDAAHQKAEIAAGMGGSTRLGKMFKRSGIVQMGARPGIGVSKKSKAQAATAMNMEIGASGKDLEAKGFNDRESLGHFAEVGHSRKTFDNRIDALRSSNKADDHLVADKLEMMRNFVGKQAYQAAALKRSAEFGGAGNNTVGLGADKKPIVVGNAFEGTAQAFSGNTAIASQVVGDAAFATRKTNLAESGWTVNPDGSAYNDDKTLQRNIARSKSSDLMAQPDLSKLDKHIKAVLSKGDESAEQLQKSLSAAMSSPMNDASPHNKAYIQEKLINKGLIPKAETQVQPVRVVPPESPTPRIVTPDQARRDGGPMPGDPGTRP